MSGVGGAFRKVLSNTYTYYGKIIESCFILYHTKTTKLLQYKYINIYAKAISVFITNLIFILYFDMILLILHYNVEFIFSITLFFIHIY